MGRQAYGGIKQGARVLNQKIASTDSTAHDSQVTTLIPPSAVSYQLCTETSARFLEITAGDSITATSHTLVVAKGAFTSDDVGASVAISGSASNNATFTIASVTNATTVVFSSGGTDETFVGTEQMIVTDTNTLDGAWTISVSNSVDMLDDTPGVAAGTRIAKWTDITAQFRDADGNQIATVAHATASTTNQYVQAAPLGAGAVKATFTGSAGHGRAVVYVKSGSY